MGSRMFVLGLLLVSHLGVMSETETNSPFCQISDDDDGWRYHSHTKTCIKVFKSPKDYKNANTKCKDFNGGDLVFILQENTNSFVKELIKNASIDLAYIGLQDAGLNGVYNWGDPIKIRHENIIFFQWIDGQSFNNSGLGSVVITQQGWREQSRSTSSPFVCQVDAVFPSPKVSCQPAEVGQQSSPVTCALSGQDLGTFSSVTIALSDKVLATCPGNRVCDKTDGYQAEYKENDHTATLTINKVGREYEGRYTCTYQFEDVPDKMSGSCDLSVYAIPSEPKCNHTFTDTGVKVVCVTDKVYPEGGCSWDNRKDLSHQNLPPARPSVSNHGGPQKGGEYFQTTCTTDVTISETGTYKFKVIMFPDGFQQISNANMSNEVEVRIAPPPDRPILKSSNGLVESDSHEVTENRIFTITCTVEGGSPNVTSTTMTCSKDVKNKDGLSTVTKNGTSVSIEINATREMNEGNCTCNAEHLVKNYKQDNFIKFSVKYPATVSNFWKKSSRFGEFISQPKSGDQITLGCKGNGNPEPEMQIFPVDVNGRQDSLVQKNTTSSFSHQMRVSCRDSGKYVCRGRNDLNTEYSEKYLDLLVKCPPVHCDHEVKSLRAGVAVNTNATIELCVFAHPEPVHFQLYYSDLLPVATNRYAANFSYTNEPTAKGKIFLTIQGIQQTELKEFKLYTGYGTKNDKSTNDYVKFTLEPKGPPSCPTEVETDKTYSDTVTLSWKPGFNGGLEQTFRIKHMKGDTIAELEETKKDTMLYNVTGLTENSFYVFSIDVFNDVGVKECSHIFVNVTTKALPVSQDSSQIIYIIIAIIAVVLIVILISIVVFLVKRRRKKKELRQSAEYKAREAGEGESLVRGDDIEDLYASADVNTEIGVKSKDAKSEKKKKDKKKEDKEKKKDKVKKKEEEDQDTMEATYAVVNKMPKKDKKGAECKAGEAGEGGSLVRGDETEDLYANVDISTEKGVNKKDAKPEKKKKDKKKDDKEKKKDKVKKKEEEDQDTMEATYAVVNKMPKKDKKETKTKKSATKSKEDKKKKEDKKGGGTEKPEDEVEVVIENDLYVKSSDLDNAEVVIENDLYAKSSDLGNAEVVIENDLYAKSSDLGNAEVVIENDLYAKSSDLDKAEVVIENDLYGKSSDLTTYSNVEMPAGAQPDPPDESVYANEIATFPPGQKLKSEEKEGKKGKKEEKKAEKDSGRTVNADGLVYVTVEINPKTKKPEAKSDVPATGGATQPSKPKSKYDPVEYVLLDHTAKVNAEGKEEGSA